LWGRYGAGRAAVGQAELLWLGVPSPPPPGFGVTVLVRDRSRLPSQSKPVRVLVGDVLDPGAVEEAVRGQDAVIILLGTRDDLGTIGGDPLSCSPQYPHYPSTPPS
uniref:NAD(P)-binding domain-containing protein n=1 Tax=Calidris pygmaea TaxID=425635 RepID=A0A8C3KU11_9CHAR